MLDKIRGTWHLHSWTYRDDGGEEQDYIGHDPGGILMFDDSGWMNVQVHASDRENFASDGIMGGSPGEISAAFTSYFAYYGTYEAGEEPSTLIHYVKGALFPNWVGDRQLRHVSFVDNYLLLTTPPVMAGGKKRMFTLKWQRAGHKFLNESGRLEDNIP